VGSHALDDGMTGTGTQACWPPAVLPNSAGRWTNKQVMELNPQHPWAPDPANMKQPRGGWDEVSQNPEAKRVRSADRNRAGKKYLDWLECEYIADGSARRCVKRMRGEESSNTLTTCPESSAVLTTARCNEVHCE
jgi:hypothetical protein